MKMISWNVNGIRACVGKNFMDFFKEADADIFCIQESKMQEGQLQLELPGYYQYWNYAEKNTTMRDESSHSNMIIFIWSLYIRQIHRMSLPDWTIV